MNKGCFGSTPSVLQRTTWVLQIFVLDVRVRPTTAQDPLT
jgi:hypothetical protein